MRKKDLSTIQNSQTPEIYKTHEINNFTFGNRVLLVICTRFKLWSILNSIDIFGYQDKQIMDVYTSYLYVTLLPYVKFEPSIAPFFGITGMPQETAWRKSNGKKHTVIIYLGYLFTLLFFSHGQDPRPYRLIINKNSKSPSIKIIKIYLIKTDKPDPTSIAFRVPHKVS